MRLSGDTTDLISGLQMEAADLRGGHVDVLVAGQEVVKAQKAKPVLSEFQDPGDLWALLLLRLPGGFPILALARDCLFGLLRGRDHRYLRLRCRLCLRCPTSSGLLLFGFFYFIFYWHTLFLNFVYC